MINRKILYFYEYASEVRGRCLGHARILVCGQLLRLTLAFSLPAWKKEPRKLYFIAEDCRGKVKVVLLGEIMPCEIMTVYNIDMEASRLSEMKICDIMYVCFFLQGEENRHLKAVCGMLDITEKRLEKLLEERNLKREAGEEASESVHTELNKKQEVGDSSQAPVCVEKNEKPKPSMCPEKTEKPTSSVCSEKTEKPEIYQKPVTPECRRTEPRGLSKHVSELMMIRPEYQPFRTKKISCSVRIGIGDVMALSEFEPGLKENSFLMHGFYRYKHILLAGGLLRGRMEYYILVPGVRNDREQRLADMYGFHEFLTLDGQPAGMGTFGYYSWLLSS